MKKATTLRWGIPGEYSMITNRAFRMWEYFLVKSNEGGMMAAFMSTYKNLHLAKQALMQLMQGPRAD